MGIEKIICPDYVRNAEPMMFLLRLLLVLAGIAFVTQAEAGDLVISRAVVDDVNATFTIADVVHRDFRPVDQTLTMATSHSAHWLRLKVRAPAKGKDVVLFIREPFLNEIRLYEAGPGDPSSWNSRVTGNHYPFSARERGTYTLGFVVRMSEPEATFYLRLKDDHSTQFTVLALPPDEADALDHQFDLLETVFVTAMLLLLAWAIHSYFLDRLPVVGLFAAHQAAYVVFGVAITGYLAPWTPTGPPYLIQLITAIPYCAVGFTTLAFCRELFRPYKPAPILMRGLDWLLLLFPLQLVLMALGQVPLAIISNMVLIKFSWCYFVLTTFFLRREQSPSRRLLQTFFIAVTLVFCAFWYTRSYGRQVLIANGLIIGGLFAMILNARTRRFLQEAQHSTMNLALAQKRLELERALKEQAKAQARTDYLTGLSNRRHFFELAERELARCARFHKPFALLMIDIDHFKRINDTWGHSAGDVVLKEVARLIRETLRDADIFGRTGGEEFAAIIVESDGNRALDVAQRLCAKLAEARIVVQDKVTVQVTISIGLSEMANPAGSFRRLLDEADQVLYQAKQQGRNRVVASSTPG
jgi:diguanylate cyclase (GGDEF)-like protein